MSTKEERRRTGSCHSKPTAAERNVDDAMYRAERDKQELPRVVQVYPHDWDRVILADEIYRLHKKWRGI